MPVRELPTQIVFPFDDTFKDTWELWKQYMFQSYQFEYKSIISEQMAIQHVVELSGGEQDKAIKIINQSIRLQYKGFFPLRQTTNGTTKPNSTKDKAGSSSTLRERVQAELNRRNGNKGYEDGEHHLKAV